MMVAVAALVPSAALTSCGGDGPARSSSPAETDLRVFAAASLTDVMADLEREFEAKHAGVDVIVHLGGSSALARQIEQGAPADVFVSADEVSMAVLVTAGVVGAPEIVARNRLAILVEAGNPQGVRTLDDLDRAGLVVVLCAPEVPCGALAAAALDAAGVAVTPSSLEENVRAAVSRVVLGEADAAIVYATDVAAAGTAAEGVDVGLAASLPRAGSPEALYPAATVTGSPAGELAAAFVAFVRSRPGQAILAGHGFLPAPSELAASKG